MQFHLNGFQVGDPTLSAAAAPTAAPDNSVDVLIVGCGPAGLTLAAQLAAFPDIHTRIVERKDGPITLGQADGVACRTMEMFEAFGFAERVRREAYWVNEVAFWKPDDDQPEHITRSGLVQDTEDGLSEFPHVILNQARVHDFYLEAMRNAPSRLTPEYSRQVVSVERDADDSIDYPVSVVLEQVDSGERETVRARYVVGCDGARSSVRHAMGRELKGDSANQAWGVMDVLAVTDFPDIRKKTAIQSANDGNVMIIPREGGYLVRLYVELDKLNENERVASKNLTVDHLISAAQRVLHPYSLDVKEVAWWSVYEIGQRICDHYDDVAGTDQPEREPRIFIAGDACHTHSPKAGQGMNFSMQDTFNLGWKLAAVLRGEAKTSLLHSYSAERQAVAQELIDFDREWATMFSDKAKTSASEDGVDPEALRRYFVKQGRFTAGVETRYRPSSICGDQSHQHLAEGFTVGKRFHSAPVLRLADAKPVHLGHVHEADGRWRLYAFADADDKGGEGGAIRALCDYLSEAPSSPLVRHTPAGADPDARFDVRAIFQQPDRQLSLEKMPSLLQPRKGRYGLIDYEKVFCANLADDDIFERRGIDRAQGCLVVVRPDQYVAAVLPLDAHDWLSRFFEGFMTEGNR